MKDHNRSRWERKQRTKKIVVKREDKSRRNRTWELSVKELAREEV